MRVPNVTEQRTRPSAQGLKYFETPDYDNSGLLRGLNALAAGVGALAESNDRERKQAERFGVLNQFNQFQVDVNDSLRVQKETTEPGDLNFRERAEQTYSNYEKKFISNLPAEYQEEFKYRAGQLMIGYLADVEQFNGLQLRKYGENEVNKASTKAKEAIDANPDSADTQLLKMNELIDNMPGYSDLEKTQMKIDNERLLRGLQYKKEKVKVLERSGPSPTNVGAMKGYLISKGVSPIAASAMLGNSMQESGLNPRAKGANDAGPGLHSMGLFQWNRQRLQALQQFAEAQGKSWSNTYVQLDFMLYEMQNSEKGAGSKVLNAKTVEEANDGMLDYLRPQGWAAGRPQGGHAYLKRLANSRRVAGQDASNEPIPDEDAVEADPRFDLVPYEDRIALSKDATTEYTQLIAAQKKAAQEEHAGLMNQLYVNLNDGKAGQQDIDDYREAGILSDYDEIAKAQEILKKRQGDVDLVANGREKLASGAAWDPTSDDDKKMLNAIVKADKGLDALQSGDEEYANSNLLPMIKKAHDIPTTVSGLLTGQMRSNDPKKATYALDILGRIQDTDPAAFNQRFTDDVASDVNWWRTMKEFGNQEDMLRQLRGGWTTEERNARKAFAEEAKEVLTKPKDPRYVDFKQVLNSVTPWFTSPELPGAFWAKNAAQADFNAIFTEEFMKYNGNAQLAKDAATKLWQRYWSVSDIGGVPTFTKYAPPTVGYPKIMDAYDWIADQVLEELGLPDGTKFQLIGDDTTKNDFMRWQAGVPPAVAQVRAVAKVLPGLAREGAEATLAFIAPQPHLPSYRVLVYDDDRQTWVVPRKPDGKEVQRMYVDPPPELRQLEQDKFQMDQDYNDAQNYWNIMYDPANRAFQEAGMPIPDEVYQTMKALNEKHEASKKVFIENEARYYQRRKDKRAGKKIPDVLPRAGVQPAEGNRYRPRAIGR